MRIIPVLDLLDGIVVHAYKGEREKYKPLKSKLISSSDPLDFIETFYKDFKFKEFYIADLNSIMKKGNNLEIIKRILEKYDVNILLDAGIDDLEKAKDIIKLGVKAVVGSETLKSLTSLREILNYSKDIVFSLDIMENSVLSKSELKGLKIKEALSILNSFEFKEIIVLYLSKVGTKEGIKIEEVREIRSLTNKKVIVGGGIKDLKEILDLKSIGINGVLIATILHEGKIRREDLPSLIP
ncbi:1-(5-phosphoribosyl)-5-[(5-phosphoribosylamino) methylideneamino] imidazole-4-carboxamide isomerase [archaeon HR06]|nr:1-(5-phosphoribosyl)-5-[(5-phosphoribosylamino) methylideneamino] imidazole-4-carboxamide isomerase [archaeon HR06]